MAGKVRAGATLRNVRRAATPKTLLTSAAIAAGLAGLAAVAVIAVPSLRREIKILRM
jgi:hypothetical protein